MEVAVPIVVLLTVWRAGVPIVRSYGKFRAGVNEPPAGKPPARSRIQCREHEGQLLLHLLACPRRALARFGGILVLFVFLAGFFLGTFFLLEQFLPAVLVIGVVEVVLFLAAVAAMAAPYLRTTFVLITEDRAVVKTVLYGREHVRQYALDDQSRARQWYLPPTPSRRHRRGGPEGIEIGDAPDGPVEGSDLVVVSDLSDESKPRFGAGLSQGELDWAVWRINQFLGQTGAADVAGATLRLAPVRIEGFPETPVPRPQHTKVRIVEDPFETRIVFPNSVETRSFSGIRSVLLGLALLAYPVFRVLQWTQQKGGGKTPAPPELFILAVVSLLGLAELLKGFTRLLGRRELRITAETITYRTTLFGIGLRFKVPTAEVISVGLPRDRGRRRRTRRTRAVAPAIGCVIRTSERELNYSEALRPLSEEETAWIIGEVARRIDAARSGNVS